MKKSGTTYKLLYTAQAAKDISKLDPSIRTLVRKALDKIAANPYTGKALKHLLSGYRSFRTTDYRIIYEIASQKIVITVIAVGHRRDVYERLKKLLPLI